jgi:UDP-N-acetylmuramyl tripeptide synthase
MKKPIRFYLSVVGAKFIIKLMKLFKRNATNLPGEIALIFYPKLLKYFDMPETVIAVTGTNGKTTVSNMINSILTDRGCEFMNNSFGGNVDTGIASILLDNCTIKGGFKKNMALFEIDERSAPRLLPYISPDYLVCTNIQRDSMKRNAHTEFIFNILNSNIPEKTKLILNGDDLISCRLAPENQRVYFGISRLDGEKPTDDNIICDIINCPECGSRLEYDFRHYNHIGRGCCTSCGFCSPHVEFDIKKTENGRVYIDHNGNTEVYKMPNKRITDLYNIAAAVALTRTIGLSQEEVSKASEKLEIVKSRYEIFEAGGREIIISLAKGQNPVACSAVCDFVRREPGNKAVIMILEDFYDAKRTSENIAWIYETDFEFLKGNDIKQIIVGGKRADDYMVRFLIAGIDREKIVCCRNETDTVGFLKTKGIDKIMVMYDLFNVVSLNSIKKQLMELPEDNQ